ncbi:MAG: hypothetical protein QM775_35370 [Pirellulales bacterium]
MIDDSDITPTDSQPPNDSERIARLERSVRRLKIGLALLAVWIVAPAFPATIALFLFVTTGLLAFIGGVMYLLETFSADEPK